MQILHHPFLFGIIVLCAMVSAVSAAEVVVESDQLVVKGFDDSIGLGAFSVVLGYDPANMEAATATGSWVDVDLGRQVTESFMDNGADIVMPVAGNVGTGSAAVMEERGFGYIFGVDQDWTLTNSQYSAQILGSVLKKMDVPVYDTIKTLVEGGEFMPGNYILSFENGGTEFVFNSAIEVPAELKAEVEALKDKIMSGELSSLSPQYLEAYPRN